MAPPKALILENVCHAIGDREIVQGVYFSALAGRITGLLGPSGSGKTTLLKIAAGQLEPTSGTVSIQGKVFPSPALRERFGLISYLPQQHFLPRDWAVAKFLRLSPRLQQIEDDPVVRPLLRSRMGSLSGGEKRYLEFLFVLAQDRTFVLLDEPFSGLAPLLVEAMCTALRVKADCGAAIIIGAHSPEAFSPMLDDAFRIEQKQCRRVSLDLAFAINREAKD